MRRFPDLRLELTADGELIAVPLAFTETGRRNMELGRQFENWAAQDGTGIAFDSSTGFDLLGFTLDLTDIFP